MNIQMHWDNVYGTKAPDQVSWFRPHLETSLSFVERSAPNRSARIIDVGGGEFTLVDDLLERGYANLTVLDISQTATDVTKARLGRVADRVEWLVTDVTSADLPENARDVWHDRAVFHFLTAAAERVSCVERVTKSVKPGDADSLHGEFGRRFRPIDGIQELHQTPSGGTQQFLYCFCAVE